MFDEHRDGQGGIRHSLSGWRKDGGDLPDDVAPPRSIKKAELRLDTQLREEIRNRSRSRQGEKEEEEEETAMMLGRESERSVTQAFKLSARRYRVMKACTHVNTLFLTFHTHAPPTFWSQYSVIFPPQTTISLFWLCWCRMIDEWISIPLLYIYFKIIRHNRETFRCRINPRLRSSCSHESHICA